MSHTSAATVVPCRVPRAALERIVLAAIQAPSTENCQPWSFSWDGTVLSVRHDAERSRHVLNRNEHATYVTLGCVLESIAIAATAEGLLAWPTLSLGDGPGTVWATLGFSASAREVHPLVPVLATRGTDRRLFQGGSSTHSVFDVLRGDAGDFPGCGLHVSARFSKELLDYLTEAESYVWRHEDSLRDVMRWMRLSRDELERTRDGMPWNTFGFDIPDSRLLSLSRSPLLGGELAGRALGVVAKRWLTMQLRSSAALVCLTVRSTRREDLVASGGLGLRAWLRLNQAGFGVQPLTSPALLAYNAVTDSLPSTARPEYVALLRGGPELIARGFGAPLTELPVWMLRTGRSPPLPPHQRAPRRTLQEVLTVNEGG
ncbi:hypothetical protein [Pyxidicoccus sp. MSG2]|uniref:hypothetical protein n=1 Tax=Pyxidicoccus sp. MSG2 TaxID=2996790 RepID=UPI00226EFCE6|nr:hypothetical protein [Pyxidicoccus sp. MSG2]MCY1022296.1 hypothetical protein [Pyxidicoccus sp. MSG2]